MRKEMKQPHQHTLPEIGEEIAKADLTWLRAFARRNRLSEEVFVAKMMLNNGDPRGARFIREEIEEDRIAAIREHAAELGVEPNFAASILSYVIAQSCKNQLKHVQSTDLSVFGSPLDDDERYGILKGNLIDLTDACASDYEEKHLAYPATRLYRAYETAMITRMLGSSLFSGKENILLDLGSGTGMVSRAFARKFDSIVGYDISPRMVSEASLRTLKFPHIVFREHDIETGIPVADSSVACVVMTLGTTGDVRDIDCVMDEIRRVLIPGGVRFSHSIIKTRLCTM